MAGERTFKPPAAASGTMAWTLREATAADLPVLMRHRDAMWVEMGRVGPREHDPTSLAYGDWLAERMRRGTLKAFLAQDGNGNVLASGAVWVQDVQPRPGHPRTMWGYILSVYTEAAARRKGIARHVVQACIEWARAQGCTRACLHASDEGRPLYEELGFEPTAEMWLDLRPPEQRPLAHRPSAGARPVPPAPASRRGTPTRTALPQRASSGISASTTSRLPRMAQ